jgi:type IX secretion system PorP/SprF family membrane protein
MSDNLNNALKLVVCLAMVGNQVVSAQDAHFTQYDAMVSLTNPALAGMYEGSDFRMSTALRSQWSKISSNFLTTALTYDANAEGGKYGFGAYLSNYDQASMLNTFETGIMGSYNVAQSNAPYTLSVGTKLGIIYKKVNDADLLFDAQYNDGYFDSDLPSGEIFNKNARLMPELSLGIAYRSINSSKIFNPFGNFAVFHVTSPDETIFREVSSDLPIRWSLMGGGHFDITEELRISPTFLGMLQGNDRLINIGTMGAYQIGNGVYRALFGASYRLDDAVSAHVGIKHRNNAYRFSYDATTSSLNKYNGYHGAFEFTIVYYGTHNGRDGRTRKQSF